LAALVPIAIGHALAIGLAAGLMLGLALLRHAWFNLEWLWSLALMLAGATALFV
jgi:hypothetical protein